MDKNEGSAESEETDEEKDLMVLNTRSRNSSEEVGQVQQCPSRSVLHWGSTSNM